MSNPLTSTPLASSQQIAVITAFTTDTLNFSEHVTKTFVLQIEDTLVIYDLNSGLKLNNLTVSDFVTLTEQIIKLRENTNEDAFNLTEVVNYSLISLNQTIADTLQFDESTTGQKIASFAVSDLLVLTDTSTRQKVIEPYDNITIIELIDSVLIKSIQISDALIFSETVRIEKPIRYVADYLILTETINVKYPIKSIVIDTLSLSDVNDHRTLKPQYITDVLDFVDSNVDRMMTISVEDNLTFLEFPTRTVVYNFDFCDNFMVDEYVSRTYSITVSDTINFQTNTNLNNVTDKLTFTENVVSNYVVTVCHGESYIPDKSGNESLIFNEQIQIKKVLNLSCQDNVSFEDSRFEL